MAETLATRTGCCLIAILALLGCDRSFPPAVTQQAELKHFDGAIEHSSSNFDNAMSNLLVRATSHLENGDLDAAKSLYRIVIENYPDDPVGYSSLGACLYFEHKYDDARSQYMQALEVDGEFKLAHYGLGCVAYEQKRHHDAIQHLKKALEIDASDRNSHRVLGMVFTAKGDYSQAISHYERAIALNGNDDSTRELLRQLKP